MPRILALGPVLQYDLQLLGCLLLALRLLIFTPDCRPYVFTHLLLSHVLTHLLQRCVFISHRHSLPPSTLCVCDRPDSTLAWLPCPAQAVAGDVNFCKNASGGGRMQVTGWPAAAASAKSCWPTLNGRWADSCSLPGLQLKSRVKMLNSTAQVTRSPLCHDVDDNDAGGFITRSNNCLASARTHLYHTLSASYMRTLPSSYGASPARPGRTPSWHPLCQSKRANNPHADHTRGHPAITIVSMNAHKHAEIIMLECRSHAQHDPPDF